MFEITQMHGWKVINSSSESISTHCACGKHKNTNLAWRDMGLILVIRKIKSSHMVDHPYLLKHQILKNEKLSLIFFPKRFRGPCK